MSLFDHLRLDDEVFKLDVDRMRSGWYSDKYFVNIAHMLKTLSEEKYTYNGKHSRNGVLSNLDEMITGDIHVEMQWFTRHPGRTLIVGLDKCLSMLRTCCGYFEGDRFVNTYKELEVWAVEDGDVVEYSGNPMAIQPVMRVRGRYRDFALLETPTLGVLSRASRVATNVYETLVAARGKPVMFFPARFDLHEVQAADGYSYQIAVHRFNFDHQGELGPLVSTDAQGDWWGGAGGGTVSHSAIAAFFGDTPEAMLAFARTINPEVARIALVDFNNDCVNETARTLKGMFEEYKRLVELGEESQARRFILKGIRLDTSASLRDDSIEMLGDPFLDNGVNPRLVQKIRDTLDRVWQNWDLTPEWRKRAEEYCRQVKIVVSGGFTVEKIQRFERLNVPVDIYAVGSSFFDNHGLTNMDFTADVVRVKVGGNWVDLAKVGRRACDNPGMERVW